MNVQSILDAAAGNAGWNEASRIAVLTDFLDALVRRGTITTDDFATYTENRARDERGED